MNRSRKCIGLRREDKSVWERRVAITPEDARALKEAGIDVVVQPSLVRVFSEEEFLEAGAAIEEELGECPVVLGIKEMRPSTFRPGGTYVFFSHTIKGQSYNMPMLKRLMELGCNLIDYEKVTDANGIVQFTTIYPGWYRGRAVHIHFKVRSSADAGKSYEFTSQFFFDETMTDKVYAQQPYATRGVGRLKNENDNIYQSGGSQLILPVTEDGQGYAATFDIGLQMA